MNNWQATTLASLADIRISNVDKKSKPGELPVHLCNYMDVYSNDYITEDLEFMESTVNTVELVKFRVEEDDVLITKDSETPYDIGIPSVVISDIEDLVCGYHLALIKPDKEIIHPIFLSKQLGSAEVVTYFSRMAAGSTRYGLSNGAIARTKISFPSLPKQRKISRILQTIDQTIKKTESLIEKYQQIKAGMMHDLFTRGIGADGKLRPPREQAPELYQETPIGWIPKEWVITPLRHYLLDNPTNGIYKPADQIGEGVLMVGQTAFTKERSVDFSLCRRGAVSLPETKHYDLEEGNILITRVFATVEGVGLPTLVPEVHEDAVFESNMMRLRVDKEKVVPLLLFEWLRGHPIRKVILAEANASNQVSVNQKTLNSLPVPLIDKGEQSAFVKNIEGISKKYFSEKANLEKLIKLKSGLMHDLLTGKVLVTVDQPEAAHV